MGSDKLILGLIWDYFYEEFHRMVLAIFWVVGEKHENNKIKGRRKSALLQDAPLKLPPDWRNWLTPIAVFLLSVFYRWIFSPISICDEDIDTINEILYCTIVH